MNSDGAPSRPRRPERRRRAGRGRFWIGLVALIAVAGALIAYRALTDPARLRQYTEHYLSQMVSANAHVEAVNFDLFDGIVLSGVAIDDPQNPSRAPAFSCEHVLLRHNPLAMLLGRLDVRELVAVRPEFRAVFDEQDHRFNLQDLFRAKTRTGSGRTWGLPDVRMRDARVRIYRESEGVLSTIEELSLNLVATPATMGARAYDIVWSGETDRPGGGRCRLDLDDFVFSDLAGGTPWLSIDAAMTAVEASSPGAQRWIELLGLTGRFRAAGHDIALRGRALEDQQITIEVDEASLSIPIDEIEEGLPTDERYVRLNNVTGRLELSEGEAYIDLAGMLHGSACSLSAHLSNPGEDDFRLVDSGLDLKVDMTRALLPRDDSEKTPAESRFIHRWKRLRDFYRDFDPHGHVNVSVSLSKLPGRDEPFQVSMIEVEALGADASCRHFPYRLDDVCGKVEIRPDGIWLLGLNGLHDGGRVLIDGWMSAANLSCAVDLHLNGRNVPLDDSLCSAIFGRYRNMWEMFDPRGAANIDVFMTREEAPRGQRAPWRTLIDAELIDAEAVFTGFPYRVDGLRGRVAIADDTITVDDVTGRCGEGTVTVWGAASVATEDVRQLDLAIAGHNLLLDERMLEAMKPQQREALAAFDPAGRFDVLAQLRLDSQAADLDYALTADLDGVDLRMQGMAIALDDVAGRVCIGPDSVELEDVVGQRGDGVFTINGTIDDPAGERRLELDVQCDDWTFDDELRAALPQAVRDAIAQWRLSGSFSASSLLTGSAGGNEMALAHRTIVALDGLTAKYELAPLPLGLTSGRLIIDAGRIELRDIEARHGETTIRLDGAIASEGDVTSAGFAIDATGLAFTDELRLAAPWRVRRAWNDIRPEGSLDLHLPRMGYRRQGDGPPQWELEGSMTLHDLNADLGVRLRDIAGTASFAGIASGSLANISVSGELGLDSITCNSHQIEKLAGVFAREGTTGRWRFDDLRGSLHDGALAVTVEVDPEEHGTRFDVEAAVQRMSLGGFVNAQRGPDSPLPPVSMTGYVDGKFYSDGVAGVPDSQRGGGQFAIRDAELYRLPLPLAILHVINLSLPEASAFQEADAEFYIVGDDMQLDNISLRGSALAMIGNGVIHLPTQELDLTLVTVSPHRWAKVPVVTELLEGAARELVEVHVTGTPQKPEASARPLRGIKSALDTLLAPKRSPLGHGNRTVHPQRK